MKSPRLLLAFAHIDEVVPSEFGDDSDSVQNLSEKQKQKSKSRRIAAFLLQRLCEQLSIDTALLRNIQRTVSGRPYILHDKVDFNISHSGDWVAVIVSSAIPKCAVGIDIEHPQKLRAYQKLLNYYAEPSEIVEIVQGKGVSELVSLEQRFYLSWCVREAVLKAQGAGLVRLSSVKHSLSHQSLYTPYCPQGKLLFYHQLPFYLACFIEQQKTLLLTPTIFQWQSNRLQKRENITPIVYQVN